MPCTYLDEWRKGSRAFGDAVFATGFEGAARGQSMQAGDGAFNGLQWAGAVGLEIGHSMEQASRVGMRGGLENIFLRAHLDERSGVHDSDAIGHL